MFVLGCVAPLCVVVTAPAALADACADPGQTINPIPWQQQVLGPERVWPFSRGAGMTVAVLSTGVDATQSQLHGRVAAGFDAVTGSGTASSDCVGAGTQVAGVIAAQQVSGVGLAGLAPSVTILPVRVSATSFLGTTMVSPSVLARAIGWAVDHHAGVIDVALPTYTDSSQLRAAVANAQAKDVVVVAAVGDEGAQADGGSTPYPASYRGVLGVGAVDPNGMLWNGSQKGPGVALVAPGAAIVTLQRGHGMVQVDGTGVASGFVAAAAALVRADNPALKASSVIQQLIATATPAAGGPDSPSYGAGQVNPYAAMTEQLAHGSSAPMPSLPRRSDADGGVWTRSRQWALIGTGAALLAVLLVLVLALALPRGRRRFWRAGLAPAPPETPEQEPGPPISLFEESQVG